jgi:hypothetical protein
MSPIETIRTASSPLTGALRAVFTTESDGVAIHAEFLHWLNGWDARNVARVRLRIEGRARTRLFDVILRRIAPMLETDDTGRWSVYDIGRSVPPCWRVAARDAAWSVVIEQTALEQREEAAK